MGNPTIKTFLRRFARHGQEEGKQPDQALELLGSYLAELCLLDYSCVQFLPSVLAASAIYVARVTIDPSNHPWPKQMRDSTGYKASELKDCVLAIHDLQLNKKLSNLVAIKEKYKQSRFKNVSSLPAPGDIPASYFEDHE